MLRALKKKEEERVGKAIFNSFCKLAYKKTWEYEAAQHPVQCKKSASCTCKENRGQC